MACNIIHSSSSSQIELGPESKPLGASLFNSIVLIGFVFSSYYTIQWLLSGQINGYLFALFNLFFFLLVYFQLFTLFWMIAGSESVIIDQSSITYRKKIGLFHQDKIVRRPKVKSVELVDFSNTLSARVVSIFNVSDVSIVLRHGKKVEGIGRLIDKQEGENILSEFRRWNYYIVDSNNPTN